MSDIAIRVENLSKAYRIGLKEQIPDTLVGAMASWMRSPLRNFNNLRRLNTFRTNGDAEDIVWALRDVSFDVKEGEVIGIIGRNGAGKSTLLKILSRITDPTSGMATIRGRVSSLLEVGTGFHPELTGRENIYMNGTILGMSKREIDRKFDEIVDFSGVEKFLDTPIKRYSSGMKVRLAFSVAAHLEPEILIIDEVLAVGDAEFQAKCLGKMEDVSQTGRTVLFVSHNLDAVRQLCTRAIHVQKGFLKDDGLVEAVIGSYLDQPLLPHTLLQEGMILGEGVTLKGIGVEQNGKVSDGFVDTNAPFRVNLRYVISHPVRNLLLGFDLIASDGTHLFRTYDLESYGLERREPGEYLSSCTFAPRTLQPGVYCLSLLVGVHRMRWLLKDRMSVQLRLTDSRRIDVTYRGKTLPLTKWEVRGNCLATR